MALRVRGDLASTRRRTTRIVRALWLVALTCCSEDAGPSATHGATSDSAQGAAGAAQGGEWGASDEPASSCERPGQRSASVGIIVAALDGESLRLEEVAALDTERGGGVLFVDAERALVAHTTPGGFWDIAWEQEPRWVDIPATPPERSGDGVSAASDSVQSFHTADLDGDGDLDVVTLHDGSAHRVWERRSAGLVLGARIELVADGTSAPRLAITDMDADGLLDLVNIELGTPVVRFGDESLRFDRMVTAPTLQQRNHVVMAVDAYDADGDDTPDIVALLDEYSYGGSDSVVAHFAGDGSGGFRAAVESVVGPTFLISPVFGDVTGDGLKDLVFVQRAPIVEGLAVHVARGRDDGSFDRSVEVFVLRSSGAKLALADMDGDRLQEIVARHESELSVLRVTDPERPGFEALTRAFPIEGLGDTAVADASADVPARAYGLVELACPEPCGAQCLGACLLDACLECAGDTDCGGGRCRSIRCVGCAEASDCGDDEQCVGDHCVRVVGETAGMRAVDVRWRGGGCAITDEGAITCFGNGVWGEPPQGHFVALAVGDGVASETGLGCAIRDSGELACWTGGDESIGAWPTGRFSAVTAAVGAPRFCGIREDRSAVCWSLRGAAPPQPPAGRYLEVGAGEDHGCGLLEDHTLRCWGCEARPSNTGERAPDGGAGGCSINYGQGFPPTGKYSALSIDSLSGCAVADGSGALVCWGDTFAASEGFEGSTTLDAGPFVDVAAGRRTACALEASGRARCFGYWLWEPRSDRFVALAGHGSEFCGLLPDGRLECSSIPPP